MENLHELEQSAYDLLGKLWDNLVEKHGDESNVPKSEKDAITRAYSELQKAADEGAGAVQAFLHQWQPRLRGHVADEPPESKKQKRNDVLDKIKGRLDMLFRPEEDN
jgi:hypothetical protein